MMKYNKLYFQEILYHFNSFFINENELNYQKPIIFISSMGRSGSTFLSDLINYNNNARIMFEPFRNDKIKRLNNLSYLSYFPYDYHDANIQTVFDDIINGRIKDFWIDSYHTNYKKERLIIKDIRSNLFLSYIEKLYSKDLRIILLIRNPIDTISSWLNSGFGNGEKEIDALINQSLLLNNYPTFLKFYKHANTSFKRLSLFWAFYYFIPLNELSNSLFIKYEDLKNENAIKTILDYCEIKYENSVLKKLNIPSKTDKLNKSKKIINLNNNEKNFIRELLSELNLTKYYKI